MSGTHQLQAVISLSSCRGQSLAKAHTCTFLFSDPASVRVSVLPSSSNNIPLTLACDVESFYPKDVSVTFLQNGTLLPIPPATEQNSGGTYTTRRYYTLSSRQREQGGLVQCVVNQPGVEHPVSGSANLDTLDPKGKILGQKNRHWWRRTRTQFRGICNHSSHIHPAWSFPFWILPLSIFRRTSTVD